MTGEHEGLQGLGAVDLAGLFMGRVLRPGHAAVDATAGNGKDTAFMAGLVGPKGVVYAFDVQEKALKRTRARLTEQGLLDRVRLHRAGHEHMAEHVPPELRGKVMGVMFNLGYLPGASPRVVTRPETTHAALDASLSLLAPGGLVTVVCYTGHRGGEDEEQVVQEWCAGLHCKRYKAVCCDPLNAAGSPVRLYVVQRLEE